MRVATPAIAALVDAGVGYELHRYDHDPTVDSYGDEAVEALGVDATRVFKTLVASVGDRLTVAVIPVAAALDLKALASSVGGKSAEMADPAVAQRATGYVLGGISPVGQRRRLPTVVDASASGLASMFVSAGRRGLEVELRPEDLVTVTAALLAPIVRTR